MKKIFPILIFLLILALMEGVSWWVYTSSEEAASPASERKDRETAIVPEIDPQPEREKPERRKSETPGQETIPVPEASAPAPYSGMGNTDSESFPPPSTEVKNGRTERTIHMGVRQYVWEPATITAKKGELVRLIIHNADVKHGLVIPDLGVDQDVPPEGAVVEFMAAKTGTFEFFCSVWCGEGHMEMRGKIVID